MIVATEVKSDGRLARGGPHCVAAKSRRSALARSWMRDTSNQWALQFKRASNFPATPQLAVGDMVVYAFDHVPRTEPGVRRRTAVSGYAGAGFSRSGVNTRRRRTLDASNTALARAAATGRIELSPAPAGGNSGRFSNTMSTSSGASVMSRIG